MAYETLSGPVAVDMERFVIAARNGKTERMRLLNACGPLELGQVDSESARQSLWLRNRKMGCEVVGAHRCRLRGRRTVEKVRGGGR